MIRIKPHTAILPVLVLGITGFGIGKKAILPVLVLGIWPLLTYSNRNITAPWVRLTLPHGKEDIPYFLFCVVSFPTEYKDRQ